MSHPGYSLSLAPSAQRALTEGPPKGLSLAVTAAVTEFLTGPLLANPQRLGTPSVGQLRGYHSARRGAYRVVYRIDDTTHVVHVLRIDHRADIYRT